MTAPDFIQRLELAEQLLAIATPPSGPVADQAQAAASEAFGMFDRLNQAVRVREPDRGWRTRAAEQADRNKLAYLTAAMLDCRRCPHLRDGGPQPVIVRLALREMACRRCAGTQRTPPTDEADRCDVCGRRGVAVFIPVAAAIAGYLFLGDCCDVCADRLDLKIGST